MAKKVYVGASNIAKNVKSIYVGVNNVARRVTKIYVGDSNGKARLCYQYSAPPIGPTVSGTWRIDEQFDYPSVAIDQSVTFTVMIGGQGGTDFKRIEITDNSDEENEYMEYYYLNSSGSVQVVYYDYDSGDEENKWLNSAYRTLYFGSTAQSVSQNFYDWLHANATQL